MNFNLHFLSDEYHLFNDVYICFNDKSVQIDHIVVSKYGVFVIETKNILLTHLYHKPALDVDEIFNLIEEQKRLVEEQKKLVEDQKRLVEEQKRLVEEQKRMLEASFLFGRSEDEA